MTKRIIITVALIAFTILAKATPFITTWDLTQLGSGANQITFGVGTTGNVNYSWSDGTNTGSGTFSGNQATISGLTTNGYITLSIDSTNFKQFKIGSSDNKRLSLVSQWGTVNWSSMNMAFNNCNNLQIFATDMPNLNNVTDMSSMFESCVTLNSPSNINQWNTSNIINMSKMFYKATNFNQSVWNWSTANVTDMSYMFDSAFVFDQPIGFGAWNTINVKDMSYMFANATNFNHSINQWNTSSLLNMSYMFNNAQAYNQPMNSLITTNVTNMSNLFNGALYFDQPLNNWITSNVTNMNSMFSITDTFNQSIGTWNTGKVTDMGSMFSGASRFNQFIGNWNTINVINMSYMFNATDDFNQPIDTWNTSNVTDMGFMFGSTSKFNQPIGSWNTSKVTNMSSMFFLANKFNQPIGSWNTSNVKDMTGMFWTAIVFNQPLNSWNTGKVKSMNSMFYQAYNFNQPIGSWNTSNVTDMVNMFSSTPAFNQPLDNWNLSAVTNLSQFLVGTGMDCSNYSSTIHGWANNVVTPNNIILDAGSHYGNNVVVDRNKLINMKNWTINFDLPSNTDCLFIPLSIPNITLQNTQSTFYPNPATNSTSIDLFTNNNESATIKVYNTLGKLVYETKLTTQANKTTYTLPTNQLASGVYMVSIVMGDEVMNKKLKIN